MLKKVAEYLRKCMQIFLFNYNYCTKKGIKFTKKYKESNKYMYLYRRYCNSLELPNQNALHSVFAKWRPTHNFILEAKIML
jgi:hypothetical protein